MALICVFAGHSAKGEHPHSSSAQSQCVRVFGNSQSTDPQENFKLYPALCKRFTASEAFLRKYFLLRLYLFLEAGALIKMQIRLFTPGSIGNCQHSTSGRYGKKEALCSEAYWNQRDDPVEPGAARPSCPLTRTTWCLHPDWGGTGGGRGGGEVMCWCKNAHKEPG